MAAEIAASVSLAEAVVDVGRMALTFARIDRTACWHPDGQQRESDSDHTVMLGWIAPALAQRLYPGELDAALVAQFALIHDMPEVYAGDTPTLRIDTAGREAKAERERKAAWRIWCEFTDSLPWIPRTLADYEQQVMPEARFTRAVDKILPKIVHLLDGAKGLLEEGMTVAELRDVFTRQAADMAVYAGEFTALMDLRAELVERTIGLLASLEDPVIDMGYLSLPAGLQADIEQQVASNRGGSLNPTPDCGHRPRKPEAATELWWCGGCREFHEPAPAPIETGALCRDNGPEGGGNGPAQA